jgi:thiamine-monophosphate kinase
MAGEFDLIEWMTRQQKSSPLVSRGIGDDLAVLQWPANDLLLVGVDQVIDGVHFDSTVHTPRQIGKKAMNRNLSDCAAMGCLPAAALVAVALPISYSLENSKELYSGLTEAADVFGCNIVGGDTASWTGKLVVSVTILGRSGGVKPITRCGAKAGDKIFVSGTLGGSITSRHMHFAPRVELGRELAASVTSMIDLSDGLSKDLAHICRESGVGAVIESERVPIHADAIALSKRDGISALEHALHDGEDYELLYTSSEPSMQGICIGRVVAETGVWLETGKSRHALEPKGWQHKLA